MSIPESGASEQRTSILQKRGGRSASSTSLICACVLPSIIALSSLLSSAVSSKSTAAGAHEEASHAPQLISFCASAAALLAASNFRFICFSASSAMPRATTTSSKVLAASYSSRSASSAALSVSNRVSPSGERFTPRLRVHSAMYRSRSMIATVLRRARGTGVDGICGGEMGEAATFSNATPPPSTPPGDAESLGPPSGVGAGAGASVSSPPCAAVVALVRSIADADRRSKLQCAEARSAHSSCARCVRSRSEKGAMAIRRRGKLCVSIATVSSFSSTERESESGSMMYSCGSLTSSVSRRETCSWRFTTASAIIASPSPSSANKLASAPPFGAPRSPSSDQSQ